MKSNTNVLSFEKASTIPFQELKLFLFKNKNVKSIIVLFY